jgi:NADH-quinone oxidoreductase subunit J
MAEAVSFYAFSGLMLLAALSVVLNRQPVYSVLSLLAAMFCLAALFVMLHAYFLAALQILLYAGAVLVLFLFVVMLLNLSPEAIARTRLFTLRTAGTIVAGVLCVLIFNVLGDVRDPQGAQAAGTVEAVGRELFSSYLLPFELTSFIILAAIVGAVALAAKQPPAK